MRDHFLSDAEVDKSNSSWHSFEAWKSPAQDTRPTLWRGAGQSWADYMDDLEAQQVLQRRHFRYVVAKTVAIAACVAVVLYVTF